MNLEDLDFIALLDGLPDSFPDTAIKLEPPAEFVAILAYDLRNISGSPSSEDAEYFYVQKVLKLLENLGAIEHDWEKHAQYHGWDREGDTTGADGIDMTMWYRKLSYGGI